MFQKIKSWFDAIFANPVVYTIWHALLGGAAGYATDIAAGNVTPTWHGLLGAGLGGLIGMARNSTNPTEQQMADVAEKALRAKGLIKMILFMLLFSACSAVMANPIGVPLSPAPGGEDDFLFAPIGALEFNPSNSSNYGLAFTESLGFAHVARVDDRHVSVDPYFFVGFFGAARISEWVNSNGGAPWSVDYGIMIGLPRLDNSLPEVAFSETWNSIDRGDAKLYLNVAFPVDILPDVFCRKLNL